MVCRAPPPLPPHATSTYATQLNQLYLIGKMQIYLMENSLNAWWTRGSYGVDQFTRWQGELESCSSTRIQSDECNTATARVGAGGWLFSSTTPKPFPRKALYLYNSVFRYHQGSEADFLRLLFWPHKLFQTVRFKQRWLLINDLHSDQVPALLGRCRKCLWLAFFYFYRCSVA